MRGGGESVKKWQNSVHAVVEWPLRTQCTYIRYHFKIAWNTKSPICGNHWVPLGCRASLGSINWSKHWYIMPIDIFFPFFISVFFPKRSEILPIQYECYRNGCSWRNVYNVNIHKHCIGKAMSFFHIEMFGWNLLQDSEESICSAEVNDISYET